MGRGISITMIFKAQSLNYGEGIGNISELKKLTRGDGSIYCGWECTSASVGKQR